MVQLYLNVRFVAHSQKARSIHVLMVMGKVTDMPNQSRGVRGEQKVYFSKVWDPEDWKDEPQYMTLFLIPNRWWSWEAWKLAWSIRAEMLRAFMLRWKPTTTTEWNEK